MPANFLPNRAEFKRLIALDILRWFAFLAILVFHSTFALWAPSGLTSIPDQDWTGRTLETFGRVFAFSGFMVLLLSFFLFGYLNRRGFSRLIPTLVLFALAWMTAIQTWPDWWDIYPFLVCALLLTPLAWRVSRPEYLAIAAATLLSIPFWQLEPLLAGWPVIVQAALVGVCQSRGDLGDWPLLPWIAYPVFALGIGRLAFAHRQTLNRISRKESLAWALAFVAAAPWLGQYYVTPLGENFGCYVFRRSPLEFWAQHVPLLFLVRLSLVERVQNVLNASSVARWFSNRLVNRRFFVVYFLHYPFVHIFARALESLGLLFHPFALSATVFCTWLSLEAGAVVFRRGFAHYGVREGLWPRTSAR